MAYESQENRTSSFNQQLTRFWAGDEGLSLLSIVLVLSIFVVFPLHELAARSRLVLDIAISALMISGALALNRGRITTSLVVLVTVAAMAVRWMVRDVTSKGFREFSTALILISLLLYVRIVLLVVFRKGPIRWNRIQGGVAAYLLLGVAWAFAYQLAEEIRPGAMHFASPPTDPYQLTGKLVYFSFVTLTTVGYGDISAVHPLARSLATAEALVGQLFPAILIATLVTMAMQARRES
jgi:Ion channel